MRYPLFIVFLFISIYLRSQTIISGYVSNETGDNTLIGAVIQDCNKTFGTVTDEFGYFKLIVDSLPVCLRVSYVGFEAKTIALKHSDKTNLNISLKGIVLDEVIISNSQKNPDEQINVTNISVEKLKVIPSIAGEPDLMKALAIAPGISLAQEGSSVLVVRGGNPEQNLILFDGIPLFNPNHLFGFFSAFNPSAIGSIKVYKGDFPAEYGGRLSSVIDIATKEGPKKGHVNNEFTIGTLSSNIYSEGPLSKNKTSYAIGGRISYLGLVLLPQQLIVKANGTGTYTNYWLYDVNANINTKVGEKGKLKLSFFHNNDNFSQYDKTMDDISEIAYKWGNTAAGALYRLPLNDTTFLTAKLNFSGFRFIANLENTNTVDVLKDVYTDKSTIGNLNASVGFDRQISKKYILSYGLSNDITFVKPNSLRFVSTINGNIINDLDTFSNRLTSFVSWVYLDNELFLNRKLKMHIGGRAGYFYNDGYSELLLEPRISLSIIPNDFTAWNFALTTMSQPFHYLSLNSSTLPNEIWLPSSELAPVESASQMSVGWFRNFHKADLKVTAELYYKNMHNLVAFVPGQSSLFNASSDWTERIIPYGLGQAYGAELFVEKEFKYLNLTLEYTYGSSKRRFAGINDGNFFPSKFDITHDFGVTAGLVITDKWSLQSLFVYQTGRPATLPSAVFVDPNGIPSYIFDEINGSRLPDYHRLDISFIREKQISTYKFSKWTFGAYNVYARNNPMYLEVNYEGLPINSYPPIGYESYVAQQTVFKFVPFLSYSLKF
jgi:hypothetical protein